jgi:pilus assembly protein FimV
MDEAREILETVLIAYPNHRRATELLQRVEAGGAAQATGEGQAQTESESEEVAPPAVAPTNGAEGGAKDAFDLAAELASELDELDTGADMSEPTGNTGDFQVSFEETFSEFKKGLSKVVKPEDVETHYDLGIAYKEMGLIDDAIGEFNVARLGCAGKKKEVDCLSMMAMLQSMKGDMQGAIESYRSALQNETAVGDVELSLRYELANAHESAGNLGKALGHLMRVQEANPNYRDVAMRVEMLASSAQPEDDEAPPPPRPRGGGGAGAGARARPGTA